MRFVELSRWLEVNTNEVGGLLKRAVFLDKFQEAALYFGCSDPV